MGKTRGVHETTPELRNRMVGMYEAGLGLREIAAAVNCSQRTVKRWLNRFDKEGTVETRDRCGRKRATTVEQDEAIVRLATQTTITAAKAVLPVLGLSCSVDTIRERLHKAGIHNWSPSRKHMKRIPLGDADGAAVQQAVWRPTGTQLGKRKMAKEISKTKKSTSANRKKVPRKIKSGAVGDGAPVEERRQPEAQLNFHFQQQNPQLQCSDIHQSTSIPTGQFGGGISISLVPQPPNVYHHSVPALDVGQNWPLDLVQNNHHFSQNQETLSHPGQHSMQHIPNHQEVQAHDEQRLQQQMQELHQEQGLHPRQHNGLKQQNLPSQPQMESVNCGNVNIDMNDNTSNESSKNDSSNDQEKELRCKKKGGKAKGTLETSVEIRNRMIGMSEAGLSTLSIALAINRSERTVKRWLERWHKEGNVQTKERKGRRRITTKEEDDAIISLATQNPLTAAKFVASALGLKCSVDTIRERLHKAGIHSWKLGKKQGEGNAVHTVHLWQPSGNRPNKPKCLSDRSKKVGSKKQDQTPDNSLPKRATLRKRKAESGGAKVVSNTVSESQNVQFHNQSQLAPYVSAPSIMQPLHNLSTSPTVMPEQISPQVPVIQPIGPMMQPQQHQRSDCRLMTPIEQNSSTCQESGSSAVYASCMGGNSGQTVPMEQTDSMNYEPYIWSF